MTQKHLRLRRTLIPLLLLVGAISASIILAETHADWYLIPLPMLLLLLIWSLSHKRIRSWAGLDGKTLWDWLQVILIPVVLGIFTIVTTTTIASQQNHTADEQLKSQILQNYTNTIQDLLLHEKLLQSQPGDNVRIAATTQTALALRQLDPDRKAQLLLFIYQTKLIDTAHPLIDLKQADLSFANLSFANLPGADLSGVILSGANLYYANLSGANLSGASLSKSNLAGTNLFGIYLDGANLSFADLKGAQVTDEELKQANSLQGATMPNGSIHP